MPKKLTTWYMDDPYVVMGILKGFGIWGGEAVVGTRGIIFPKSYSTET